MSDIKVIFILGPTASGKTKLSIDLAKHFGGEVINADSIQVYKSLDIGSAKPTASEMLGINHHLIGHINEGSDYTAGEFRKDVLGVIKERYGQGVKNFFIVGGSGFYIKALIDGMYDVPSIPEEIQRQVRSEDIAKLYEELKKVDPQSAQKISANDTYRITRAIEIFRATGKTFTYFREEFEKNKQTNFPYQYFKIGLKTEKNSLKERVERRAAQMIEQGLLLEVQSLVDRGFADWDALQSVGYKEALMCLRGDISPDNLLPEITKNTMGLIKRQLTWFKKDQDVVWFEVGTDSEFIIQFLEQKF